MTPRTPWYKEAFRQVHMDFHMPEFPPEAIRNFDAKQFVDHLEHGKVQMVALFAKCHFGNSFYDTRVGHKHRGLEADFLRETAAECRRRGIRTLAYYSLCWEKRAWDENPDWRWRDAQGESTDPNRNWGWVCMNSPYKDELVMPQLREIAAEYPVDGIWLDIPTPSGSPKPGMICHCNACRAKWRQLFGKELEDLSPREQVRLDLITIEDYLREVRAIIAESNPELVLGLNHAGNAILNKRIKELCEMGTWESQPHLGDYLGHSFAARLGRNDITDLQIMTVRFYEWWGDLSLKPTAQLTTECASIVANGATVCVGDQVQVDGSLQPPVYDTLRESFSLVEQAEPHIRDAESVGHVHVMLSTPDAEQQMSCLVDKVQKSGIDDRWRGAHKMLVESHVSCDFHYSLFADDLEPFPLIVLPEPGPYPQEFHERLRSYVEAGGTLLAVGTALRTDNGMALEDVFGIELIEPFASANEEHQAVHFVPHPEIANELPALPHQVRGPAMKFLLRGAEELAALHLPQARSQPPVKAFRSGYAPASQQRSPFAFATQHRYGRGRAIYLGADVFGIYWRWNHNWLRQLVANIITHCGPTPPFRLRAPTTVEANLMRSDNGLLLNLVHYDLPHGGDTRSIAGIERHWPLHGVEATVRCTQVDRVVSVLDNEEITFTHQDGWCRFAVPPFAPLSMIRLDGANGPD